MRQNNIIHVPSLCIGIAWEHWPDTHEFITVCWIVV